MDVLSWLLGIVWTWSVLFAFTSTSNYFCFQCLPQLPFFQLDTGFRSVQSFRDIRAVIHTGLLAQAYSITK